MTRTQTHDLIVFVIAALLLATFVLALGRRQDQYAWQHGPTVTSVAP